MTERVEIDLRARERRVYDRLRARVVRLQPGAGAGLRDLLLFLPDLIVLLYRLTRDPRIPAGAKAVAVIGIGYAFMPLDILPEILFGPFGFLDDLLIAAGAVSYVVNHVHPDIVRAHWPGPGDVLDVVKRVLAWSEQTIGRTLTRVIGFREKA